MELLDKPPGLVLKVLRFPLVKLMLTLLAAALFALLIGGPLALGSRFLLPEGWQQRPPLGVALAGQVIMYGVLGVAFVLAILVVARFVERRRADEVGLGVHRSLRECLLGYVAGAALISLVILVLAVPGWFRVGDVMAGEDVLLFAALLFTMMLLVGFFEEFMFRGVIFRHLEELLGSIPAIALSGVAFGFIHHRNPNATLTSSVAISIEAGILLALVYMATRRIWAVAGLHGAWNFTMGNVWGLPVSGVDVPGIIFDGRTEGPGLLTGGSFGPEAGLVALTACLMASVPLAIYCSRHGRFYWPNWVRRILHWPPNPPGYFPHALPPAPAAASNEHPAA